MAEWYDIPQHIPVSARLYRFATRSRYSRHKSTVSGPRLVKPLVAITLLTALALPFAGCNCTLFCGTEADGIALGFKSNEKPALLELQVQTDSEELFKLRSALMDGVEERSACPELPFDDEDDHSIALNF